MLENYSFLIGDFQAISISDSDNDDETRTRKIIEVFMECPPEEIDAFVEEKGISDKLTIGANVLYLNTGKHHVLVDSGVGDGFLHEGLKNADISPDQIDYLIITHGDWDHINGLLNDQGKSTFPNARIVMWEKAWELWTTKDGQEKMVEDFMIVADRMGYDDETKNQIRENRPKFGNETLTKLQSQLTLVEIGEEIVPGIRLFDCRGHRRDMVGVEISSNNQTLIHVSDSLRHEIQAEYPHYICYIDSYADEMFKKNVEILKWASSIDAIVFCTHLIHPGLAKITTKIDGWDWENLK